MARCKGEEVELVCLIFFLNEFIHLFILVFLLVVNVVGFCLIRFWCCVVLWNLNINLRNLRRSHSAAFLMELFWKPNLNLMKHSVTEKPAQF